MKFKNNDIAIIVDVRSIDDIVSAPDLQELEDAISRLKSNEAARYSQLNGRNVDDTNEASPAPTAGGTTHRIDCENRIRVEHVV